MVIIITGASAGIGRRLAIDLHARGAKLVLAARRIEKLYELREQLGGGHLSVTTDVSNGDDCRRLIEQAVERFGRIDTLVANAGYGLPSNVHDTTPGQVEAMFRTNVFGTIDCARAAVGVMAGQTPRDGVRGQIMIVSSGAARRGLPYFGVYSATKAAQLSIAEAMRVELSPKAIAVTSVHPIGTETDFFTVAESLGETKIQSPMRQNWRQPVERVTVAMVRAIAKPRAEVWTSLGARWGLALNALMPSVGDAVMRKQKREIDAMNGKTND